MIILPSYVKDYNRVSSYYAFFYKRSVLKFLIDSNSIVRITKNKVSVLGIKFKIPLYKQNIIREMKLEGLISPLNTKKSCKDYKVSPLGLDLYERVYKLKEWDPSPPCLNQNHKEIYKTNCNRVWKTCNQIWNLKIGEITENQRSTKFDILIDLVVAGYLECMYGKKYVEGFDLVPEPSFYPKRYKLYKFRQKYVNIIEIE